MHESIQRPHRQRRTVLQIEDNCANAAVVEQLLEPCGDLILLTAITGYQGVNMACMKLPDVILLEINLPDIKGLSALRFLQGMAVTAHIPVIALSSDAVPLRVKEGLTAGFFRYITRPYHSDVLMAAIDAALELSSLQWNIRKLDRRLLEPTAPRVAERRFVLERRFVMVG